MIIDRDADGVRSLALSIDGATLAVVDDAGWLRIWSLPAAKIAGEGPTEIALPHAVVIAPDGRTVAVVGEGGGALFSTKAEPRGALPSFGRALQSCCFLPDGRLLITSDDGRLRLIDLSGRVLSEAPIGERNAGVSSDGKRFVVAASWQGGSELIVGQIKDGRLLVRTEPKITLAIDGLSAAALDQYGSRALLPARDLVLFDLDSGRVLAAFDPSGAAIPGPTNGSILHEAFWSHAASMGGDRLAAASPADGRILVVDAKTAKIVSTLEGHPDGVTALAGAPGVLVSAGLDRTLRAWR